LDSSNTLLPVGFVGSIIWMTVPPRKMSLLALVLAAGWLPLRNAHGQTVQMLDPVGYNLLTLPAGNSIRVNPMVQAKVFQAIAGSVSSDPNSVITVSGSAAVLAAGAYNETATGPAYYLEVLSTGSGQGLIADVVSNTANTITVAQSIPGFGVSGTTTFCIRPHTTLSSLFPASNSALSPYVDTLELFFPDGSSKAFLFTGVGSGWVDPGMYTDAGGVVIYPGQGFVMNVATSKSVPIMGSVKAGPTIVPLYAGEVNLVGTINSQSSGPQTLSSYALPASLVPNVDTAGTFVDDGSLDQEGSYMSNGTSMVDQVTLAIADSEPVPPTEGVLVSVGQSENWVMPSFFTSGQ